MVRTLSEVERTFIAYLDRKYPLDIHTRLDELFVVAEIPSFGISSRGKTTQGAKRNAVSDALAVFKSMDKSIVDEQFKSLGRDEGVNIWSDSNLRMHVIEEILTDLMDKPVLKKLVHKRLRKPMHTKSVRSELRSVTISFQCRCMGRNPYPF